MISKVLGSGTYEWKDFDPKRRTSSKTVGIVFTVLFFAFTFQALGSVRVEPELISSPTDAPIRVSLVLSLESARPERGFWTVTWIELMIRNVSSKPVLIDWDKCALLEAGESHRIIHEGVRLIDKDKPQAPTMLAPFANLRTGIWPADEIEWLGTRWYYGVVLVSETLPLGLVITWEIDGSPKTDTWLFKFIPPAADVTNGDAGDWVWWMLIGLLLLLSIWLLSLQ